MRARHRWSSWRGLIGPALRSAAIIVTLLIPVGAGAQDYPTRTVKMIVPYPAANART